MRFSKYNAEGYHDLTAYGAFRNIDQEQKQTKQAIKQLRANFAVYRPIVYICSPYAGDVKQNVRRAQAYCRFAVQNFQAEQKVKSPFGQVRTVQKVLTQKKFMMYPRKMR